jgi:Nif11 domain
MKKCKRSSAPSRKVKRLRIGSLTGINSPPCPHPPTLSEQRGALTIAPQNLERFRQLVLADRSLFEQLRQTADLDGFVALAVRLGAEQGCVFTEQEVREAVRAWRRAWLERWI